MEGPAEGCLSSLSYLPPPHSFPLLPEHLRSCREDLGQERVLGCHIPLQLSLVMNWEHFANLRLKDLLKIAAREGDVCDLLCLVPFHLASWQSRVFCFDRASWMCHLDMSL